MASVPLEALPPAARTAWLALREQLQRILGADLVAMWAHGGTTWVNDPPHEGDLDTYVIVSRAPDAEAARRIEEIHDALDRDHGADLDIWYVLADDARSPDPPRHAFREGKRDTSWALHRTEWLAGHYVPLHGAEPSELVVSPDWAEVEAELSRELEHIERHVAEGDTDSYEATYAVLNGSRILHALDTGNVVLSKHAAGMWALQQLPARWHATLQAALSAYRGQSTPGDGELLAAQMAPFVAFVRQRLPALPDRPPEGPRWSGH